MGERDSVWLVTQAASRRTLSFNVGMHVVTDSFEVEKKGEGDWFARFALAALNVECCHN